MRWKCKKIAHLFGTCWTISESLNSVLWRRKWDWATFDIFNTTHFTRSLALHKIIINSLDWKSESSLVLVAQPFSPCHVLSYKIKILPQSGMRLVWEELRLLSCHYETKMLMSEFLTLDVIFKSFKNLICCFLTSKVQTREIFYFTMSLYHLFIMSEQQDRILE